MRTVQYKLGKQPAAWHPPVELRLADVLDTATVLPQIPDNYGHENLITNWGMLGNDAYGDCFWAGSAHEHMLLTAEAGHPVSFTTAGVLGDYGAATGFDPSRPDTDQGTNLLDGMRYRKRVGVVDAFNTRHKVGLYLALDPGDTDQLHAAAYLFSVGIGVRFPKQWMTAFSAGAPWDKVRRPSIEGGHYITAACRRAGNTGVVSWGRIVWLTDAGYRQFNDESYVFIAADRFAAGGLDINGVDQATLARYMRKVGSL